jgi:dihydroflavonol-4-reductase
MRALVTGGPGFVGSAVVRELLSEGYRVSCLVRPESDLRNLAGLDVALVQGDLGDATSLREALRGCQELYHVAAYYSTRPEEAERMFAVNALGSQNVLSVAAEAGLGRIVHTSTIGTIGRPEGRLPTEEDVFGDWEKASPYVRSKLEGERAALELARRGAPIVVVNPCAPVGPRDIKPSSTGARIIAYLQGRSPSFLAGGINFVAVEDVARGHILAARRGRLGERYILGNAEGNLDLAGFCALMERASGVRLPGTGERGGLGRARAILRGLLRRERDVSLGTVDYRPEALTADPSKAIRELSLPQTPLEVAFRQAVEWFRAQGYV